MGFVCGLWVPGVRLGWFELKLYLVAGGDGSEMINKNICIVSVYVRIKQY